MAQQPPPPPPPAYGPTGGGTGFAGATAPGVILIILGVLYALFGVIAVVGGGALAGQFGGLGGAVIAVGVIVVAYGILDIISGVKVMGGSNGWRIGGIVLTAIGALLGLLGVIGAFGGEQEVTGFDPNTFEPITTGGGLNIANLLVGLLFLAANLTALILLARLKPANAP